MVYRSLSLVWHQDLHNVSTACRFSNGQYFEAVFFGFVEGFAFA